MGDLLIDFYQMSRASRLQPLVAKTKGASSRAPDRFCGLLAWTSRLVHGSKHSAVVLRTLNTSMEGIDV